MIRHRLQYFLYSAVILYFLYMFILRPFLNPFLWRINRVEPHDNLLNSSSMREHLQWQEVQQYPILKASDNSENLIILQSDFTVLALSKDTGEQLWEYKLPYTTLVTFGMLYYSLSVNEEYIAIGINSELFLLDVKKGQLLAEPIFSGRQIENIQFFPGSILINGNIPSLHGENFFSELDFAGNIKWEKIYGHGNYDLLTICPTKTLDEICMVHESLFLIWNNQTPDPKIIKQSQELFPLNYQTYGIIGNLFSLNNNMLIAVLQNQKILRITDLTNYSQKDISLPCTFNSPISLLSSPNLEDVFIACDTQFIQINLKSREDNLLIQLSNEYIVDAMLSPTEGNIILLTDKAKIIVTNSDGQVLGDLQTVPNKLEANTYNQIFADANQAYVILDGNTIITIDTSFP